jgi:gamma-glutamylcyclotransferase (GGCT)/AIG2-like uncharacterized protein YtfP
VSGRLGPSLFVYGSLRSDAVRTTEAAQRAFATLAAAGAPDGAASLPGKLFAVSWYPGWVPGVQGRVQGELWALANPAVLTRLDRYEGPDYVRELRQVRREDGRRATAWIYRHVAPVAGVPLIRSGDYVQWAQASGSRS